MAGTAPRSRAGARRRGDRARASRPTRRLRVGVSGSGSLFRIQEMDQGGDAGTRVRLYLTRTTWKNRPISCLTTLSGVLWVAEFTTVIRENAEEFTWLPGELRCPHLLSDQCVNADHKDVWWTTSHGRILVDGIAVGPSQYNFVIANLRGPHRPKLMLSRNEIMHVENQVTDWDRAFVDDTLLAGWQMLLDWPHLTMNWLWKAEQANHKLVESVVTELSKLRAKLRIGVDKFSELQISISRIGCFSGDDGLVNLLSYPQTLGNMPDHLLLGSAPSWLLPYRLVLWEDQGVPLPNEIWRRLSRPEDPSACPMLIPGDSVILSASLDRRNWVEEGVSAAHLVRAAAKLGESIGATFERFRRFFPLGLQLPNVNTEELNDLVPAKEDLILLSTTLQEGGESLGDRVSLAHIIRAAVKLQEPIRTIVDRCRQYASLGLDIAEVDDSVLADVVVTPEHLIYFSQDLNESGPSIGDRLSAVQLIHIAGKFQKTVGAVVGELRQFAQLGLQLPEADGTLLENLAPTKDDRKRSRHPRIGAA